VAHMRERRFDLALQWHGGGRNSNPFVRSLGARVTAGFATPDAPPLDRTLPYITSLPERLRLIEGARLVGATTTDDDPRLHVTDADRAELASVLPDAPDPLVVIQPGARDPRRRWSARHFAVVADAFAARGARIAINGTEDEAACVNEVCSRMRHDSINLTGRLSLGALAALCEHARLMISNDTGPLHLARAVGTRNVGIYWAGNLITHGPVRSWRDRVAASWRMACPVCECHCMQHDCEHRVSFVDDVHPRDVEALALELYALERNRSLSRSITPNSSHSLPTAY
ncbi:MAG TPA: glycosyltransferase family 9 protein, partial [Burkholderiaceae bacterium]|nr:glycosyltransferase family 9 protein [Burkholderiaceae bacterium]